MTKFRLIKTHLPAWKFGLPFATLLASLIVSPLTAAAQADTPAPLRLCADPTNLPFSSNDARKPGIYVEIGSLVAKAMGRDMEPVWSLTYFGKHNLHETLLSGQCDLAVGLPEIGDFMGPRVIFSKPLFKIGYAIVSPAQKPITNAAQLKGLRIGVQYDTGPQNYIAARNDVQAVTFMDPDSAMKALADGKIDAAFIWAPTAGYMNKTMYEDRYKVIPVSGLGMQWRDAIGFDKKHPEIRDAVDNALAHEGDAIQALLTKYGFPTDPPIDLNAQVAQNGASDAPASTPPDAAKKDTQVADQTPAQQPAAAPAAAAAAAAPGPNAVLDDDQWNKLVPAGNAKQGDVTFNGTCAHCHGPNAETDVRRQNLRLLHHRYGDDMNHIFYYTVTHGRPTAGMPNWTGVFTNQDFANILAYLHTLQTTD